MISSSLMSVQLRQTTRSPSRASRANRLSFSILRIYGSPSLTGNPCKNCRLLLEYAVKQSHEMLLFSYECHMLLGVSPELFHKLPGVLGREYLHLVRKAEVEPADRSKAVKVCV